MSIFYNAAGQQTVNGTTLLDRYYAFTKDDNFDHVRADAVLQNFTWTTSIQNADGSYFTYTAPTIQVSMDTYVANGGVDVLYGSNLNDAIFFNNGVYANGIGTINSIQQFDMAGGDDFVDFSAHGAGGVGYAKQVNVHGGDGNDTIIGGTNNDELFGDAGNDVIIGNAGGDTINGGDGDDIIYGDDTGANLIGGQDVLRGGNGNDTLYGGAKQDRLEGGNDNDTLYGGASDDVLYGGAGNDILYGDDANGGTGGDKLFGDDGNDELYGGGGADQLDGGAGDDLVNGGDGNDAMKGGTGNDRLVGGSGNDTLDGGADTDIAVFSGARADYRIGINADGSYQLTDMRTGAVNDGSDTLRNIENVEFSDGTIAFNLLDNPPVITSNGGGATGTAALDENTTLVTTVTATDPDAGQTLTYSLAGGADSQLFTLDATTGVLSFIKAPDFENPIDANGDGIYEVAVQAFDGAIATTQSLSVSVNNVADGNAPIFTSNGGGTTATIQTNENASGVTTLIATDADGTQPTYTIVGGADAGLFTLDVQTGVLNFINAPNFEAPGDADGNNIYEVVVEASDGLNGDRQKISVAVQNVNDNAPTIVSAGNITLDENIALATTIVAVDADNTTPGFAPQFSIAGGADSALFSIDAATGALTFITAPDFENPADSNHDNQYDVVVKASDGLFNAQQNVSITVSNINDNAPKILSNGGTANTSITLSENSTAVTTVQASDADGTVPTFRIAGGLDAALFALDAATGALIFKSAPDFENPEDSNQDNRYQVIVEATDGTFATPQTIEIVVTDINEVGRTITGTAGNDTFSPTAAAAFRTTALNDVITGLAGNDTIDGGAGVDRMDGGAGNDIYYVDVYSDDGRSFNDDLVIEAANGGVDRVNASVSYRLASEVEHLTLLGTADINGTGNDLDNQIIGNSGANILSGGGGNDTILGNDGNDTIVGDDGNDTLVGGNGNDILSGGLGNDKLDGGVGADTMAGGDGDDTYIVDTYSNDGNSANDDAIIEAAGGGTDTVTSSVSYFLAAEVENLTLSGTAAIDGTGNQSANTLTGNNGANTLLGLDGNDIINGLGGDDTIDGGAGSDTIDGGAGNDRLMGGEASDILKGGAGADIIVGGAGKDTLTGGTEGDTFVFKFADTTMNTNLDRITDFQGAAGDRIDLDFVNSTLPATSYAEGSISTNNFSDAAALAKTLMDSTHNVVFVAGSSDGWLFWDGAGNDGIPDQAIAFTGGNSLNFFSADFVV
jgi:Ca2+-binding RTX toxin-like protein